MLKTIYKSLFDISSYREKKGEKIIKTLLYLLVITVFSGIFFATIGFFKVQPIIDSLTDEMYNDIPDFTLSASGLNIQGDEVYEITFAGKSFYIDGNKDFLDIAMESKLDDNERVMFIGRDGYANVVGRTLESGNYFEDVAVLKDVTLCKDDFTLIYEVIRMINKDLIIIGLSIIVIAFVIWMFIRNALRGLILYIVVNIKEKDILYKDAYKMSIYSDTFYALGFLLIILVGMNVNIVCKMFFMEIVSLLYLTLTIRNLLKKEI